jgi:hypothetical protein
MALVHKDYLKILTTARLRFSNVTAQFLYRNNPRYSNLSDSTTSPAYMHSMTTVSNHLKARLYEMQLDKRVKEKAEQLAKEREAQRRIMSAAQMSSEKKALFHQLLTTIFRKWTAKLWRFGNAFLLKKEMVRSRT